MSPTGTTELPYSASKLLENKSSKDTLGALPLSYRTQRVLTGFEPATTRLQGEVTLNYTPSSENLILSENKSLRHPLAFCH